MGQSSMLFRNMNQPFSPSFADKRHQKNRSEIRKKHWASELPGRLDNAQICEQMVYYLTPASFTWFTVGGGGEAVFELTLPSAGGKRNRSTKPSYLTTTRADVPERPNMAPEKCLRLLLGQIQPESGRTEPKKKTKTPHRMWSSVCRVGRWKGGVASAEAAVWIWRRTVCSLDWLDWFLWCCWFLWYFTRRTWRRRWIPWMIQAGHQGRKIQAECGNEAARRQERRSETHRTGIFLRNVRRIKLKYEQFPHRVNLSDVPQQDAHSTEVKGQDSWIQQELQLMCEFKAKSSVKQKY